MTEVETGLASHSSNMVAIVKKSLKMSIPKVDSEMSFSESGNSSPKVSFFKEFKKEEDEGIVIPEQPVYPPEIINISDDDDDLSSIESCFMNEITRDKALEPNTFEPEVIEIIETGQEESSPERDTEVRRKGNMRQLSVLTVLPKSTI